MTRLALIASAIALCAVSSAHAKGLDDYRTIHVSAEHQVKMMPDMAVVHFAIFAEHTKADVAKEEADQQLSGVKKLLNTHKIASKHLKSGHISVQPRYRYHKGRDRTLEGYQVSYALQLTVHDLNLVGQLLQGFTEAGISRVNNVHYTLHDDEQAKSDALLAAMKKARAKAMMLAQAEGDKLGEALKISEGHVSFNPHPVMMRGARMMVADAESAKAAEAPPVGELDISASISVIYELDE